MRYCAAQAVYQRPAAVFNRGSRPRFRPRPPDCKFINAAPIERADPQSSIKAGNLSRPAPNGRFIKGFSQFIKASSNQKGRPLDLVSLSTAGRPWSYLRPAPMASLSRPAPNGHFIKGFNQFVKASSRPALMAILSRALASLSRPAPTRRADP